MATKDIKPIKVDGYTFPMHSDYFFDLKKTYKESPTRGLDGKIARFPDKFFVPYFTVKYAVLNVDAYQQMMSKLQNDEQVVEYYDGFTKEYRTAKFYVQQPTYNRLYGMKQQYHYVLDLELIFSGTLNDVTSATVTYNLNGGTGVTPASVSGYTGDEFTVANGGDITKSGSTFYCWNTSPDGSGINYAQNSLNTITVPSMTLYAKWI